MEKKNIYIILIFILVWIFWISFWYYLWVKDSTTQIDKKLDEYIKNDLNNFFEKEENFTWKIEKEKKSEEENIKTWNLENFWTGILNNENNLDFEKDDSIQKFVTSTKSFDDLWYVPNNLEKISSNFVFDSKWWQVLRKEANDALQLMAEKFFQEKNEKISVVSAYRSYDYQVWIKKWWCPDNLCAKAWFSEHQTGLVVDLWSASSEETWKNNKKLNSYFEWLNKNAHKFGFHNTYQKWIKIDWYDVEPWHWRYLWIEFATYLKENNFTFAEYYKSL